MSRCVWTVSLWLLVAVFCSGCSLAGTWKTVAIEPGSESGTPISMVTFDESTMMFTASEIRNGQTLTTTGRYSWNGSTLKLLPDGRPERTYEGTLWWGTTLKLTCTIGDQQFEATLEKQRLP